MMTAVNFETKPDGFQNLDEMRDEDRERWF
jgi:hypothetical protein